MIIYKTTNLLNGKIYVGKDKHNNEDYLGSGLKLKNAINKYGKANFQKEILEFCDSEDLLNTREIYWIQKLQCTNPHIGYNIAEGGNGGNTRMGYSKEELDSFKENVSKGLRKSEAYQELVRSRTGKPRPDHSKKMKELYESGKLTPHNKGKVCPDHVKQIVSNLHKGQPLTEDHKFKIGKSKWVKVEMYDKSGNLVNTFDSIKHACEFTGIKRDSISGCCLGKYKSGGGYVWKYKDKTQ